MPPIWPSHLSGSIPNSTLEGMPKAASCVIGMKEMAETLRQEFSQVVLRYFNQTWKVIKGKGLPTPSVLFAFASPKEFFVTVSKIGTRFEHAFLIFVFLHIGESVIPHIAARTDHGTGRDHGMRGNCRSHDD